MTTPASPMAPDQALTDNHERTFEMATGSATLTDEVRRELEHTIEHFNSNHADTVLFLARHHGGVPTATDAEAVGVDAGGIDLLVTLDGTRQPARVPFGEPVSDSAGAQTQFYSLLASARGAVGGNEPLTSLESELAVTATLPTRLTTVAEVDELTPNLRRLVLRGGLEEYRPLGGDDFAYLFVPGGDGGSALVEGFSMASWQALPAEARPIGAYYTIRRFDPSDQSIELWVVIHGHGEGVGGWAASAEPGATVALWGPRRSYHPPAAGGSHLFVADESGFAAVAALLDTLDPGAPATVILETVDPAHELPLPDRPGTAVTWLHRGDAEPGTSPGFVNTVRALDLDPVDTVAFGAGESRQITALRRYLRRDLGLGADRVFLTGYWRR